MPKNQMSSCVLKHTVRATGHIIWDSMKILREQDKGPEGGQCTYILKHSCKYTLVVLMTASAH